MMTKPKKRKVDGRRAYTFKELLEASENPRSHVTRAAVESARDTMRDWVNNDEWYDLEVKMWAEALEQIGFANADIRFSGFWSPGDGASFTASVDMEKLIAFLAEPPEPSECIGSPDGHREEFRPWLVWKANGVASNPEYKKLLPYADYFDCKVERDSHDYSHEKTCRFHGDFDDSNHEAEADDYEWTGYGEEIRNLAAQLIEAAEGLRLDLCRAIYKDLEAEYDYQTSDACYCERDYLWDKEGEHVGQL